MFSILSQAWNNSAKSMIPKMMIRSTGSARANSMSAWDRLLPDLNERLRSYVEKLSFFIGSPLMG
jgi:hypothetical protein